MFFVGSIYHFINNSSLSKVFVVEFLFIFLFLRFSDFSTFCIIVATHLTGEHI